MQAANSDSPTKKANAGIMKARPSKERPRSDSYGNQIKPGSKKHKIGFKPKLTDVFEVESYKEYNADETPIEGKKCCNIM